jgi:hypothetical protein
MKDKAKCSAFTLFSEHAELHKEPEMHEASFYCAPLCVGPPGQRSIGPGLNFLLLFPSREKVEGLLFTKEKNKFKNIPCSTLICSFREKQRRRIVQRL